MKHWVACVAVAASLLCPSPRGGSAFADATTEPDYKQMPWHLIDVWWDVGKAADFESYSIDVTIGDDVPADVSLYVAPLGLGHLSGTAFYGGMQTRSDGATKRDPKQRPLGRGLLFSMWGERSFDAIRCADGGFCQSSGHEGDFVSARRPYEWKKGLYTYRLVRMDRETIDGQAYTWVGAFLFSHDRDENVFIGALRFKGDKLVLEPKLASFVEIYGQRRPIGDIPKVTVTLGNLKVNGEPVTRPGARAIYPKGVPDYANAEGKDGRVVITVGEAVADRKERTVPLLEK